MLNDDQLAVLSRKIDSLAAREAALEAMFDHVVVPIVTALIPGLALPLITAAREMEVKLPPDSPMRLLVEEKIAQLADRLERKLRSRAS